jgi:hypothetical protein
MNNLTSLAEVIVTEAELTEQLIGLMKRQQEALVNIDGATVTATVESEQELLLPIEALEQERMRLTKEVWNEIASTTIAENEPIHLSMLVEKLESDDAKILSAAGSRLHAAVEQMLTLSQANQFLIEHSRKFVRSTFRIITGGYSRQLVDQRI